MTAAEKRAAKGPKPRLGKGRPAGTYRYVDSENVRLARHAYAAVKRLADLQKRTLTDVLTELVMDSLARQLGVSPADLPSRKL